MKLCNKIIIAHKLKNHDVKSLTKLWKDKTETNQTKRNSANNENTIIVLKYQTDDIGKLIINIIFQELIQLFELEVLQLFT